MTSPAIDLTNAVSGSSAELSFYMHAYGSEIGTLYVIVNTDTLFTHTGQLQPTAFPWAHIGVDLSAYVGQSVNVSFSYAATGPGWYGDLAIDMVQVEACVSTIPGCTDSTAANYNPSATQDDGSCLYAGCTDTLATNYDSTANLDDGSCVYPPCAAPAPYHQEFTNGALPIGYCVPNQWATSVTTGDGWRFVGTPGYLHSK